MTLELAAERRGRFAWHMPLKYVLRNHSLGLEYPINGDAPERHAIRTKKEH